MSLNSNNTGTFSRKPGDNDAAMPIASGSGLGATSKNGGAEKKAATSSAAKTDSNSGATKEPGTLSDAEVLSKLTKAGVENVEKVGRCVKAGIARGFIQLESPADLDTVLVSAVCDEVFGFECKNKIDATLRMVLHQKDEGIDEYLGLDDYAVRCDGCEQGYYITDLCTGDPAFSDPKDMHHCADCPGLGKCIGDIRVRHCKKCDGHYFAGSNANLKCQCKSEGKSVSKASNDESDDECETEEDSESDSEEDSDMDEEAPSLADCILGLMKDFASKNQATIPTGPQAMTDDQVLEKLRRLGVEDLDKVSGCVKAGIARGFIKLETASDLDKVIVAKTCNKILPTDCTHKVEATVKMVLHQKDWGGDEYNCIKNEHPVCCGKCGEGYFVSWICGGEPTLCYSKHMNHCKKCPDLGVCLGCCREDHCDRCGKHYFAGSMRDMPCDAMKWRKLEKRSYAAYWRMSIKLAKNSRGCTMIKDRNRYAA